jgi:penicillin amidase
MRKIYRRIFIPVGALVFVFVVLFGTWSWYSRKAYPKTRGTVKLEGLTAPVEVYRDAYGVPHVYARTVEDLFFAQGYVHAQDRFWQMEFWRRIGSGRLSELFGEAVLGTDMFIRTMGFERIVQQEYEWMDAETRLVLDSYVAGVNAYILDRKPSRLGLEFSLLELRGVEFEIEPWEPVNSLTWIKVMSLDAESTMEEELDNIERIRAVGLGLAADFLGPYRDDTMPYIVSDDELLLVRGRREAVELRALREEHIAALMDLDTRLVGGFDSVPSLAFGERMSIGSNSWVLSGSRTSTGKALLANDPHLGIQMPSVWYEIGLHCVGSDGRVASDAGCPFNVRGVSMPGFPGVIIGHNEHIAWGETFLYADTQDLFIERINPENPNQYEVNGEWVDMEIVSEEIVIHDVDEPYRFLVRSTRHGPIVTDHGFMLDYSDFGIAPQRPFPENLEFTVMSLSWPSLRPVTTLKSLLMINRARNFEEFRKALRYWNAPSVNFVYADVEGNIGYQMPGKVPIRRNGEGMVPVPGWTDDFEWLGFIPYEELPSVYNPEKGYIVTANNPVASSSYPYLISNEFSQGYRAKRIGDMIEADRDGISIEDTMRMQGDDLNLSALEIMPYLRDLRFEDSGLEAARDFLMDWNGRMHRDSPQAALYGYFWQKLIEETFKDQLIEKLWPPGGSRLLSLYYFMLQNPASRWWDDVTTLDVVEERDDILVASFTKAHDACVEALGERMEDWRWGDLHTAEFRNQTFGESGIGPIEAIFNRGPVSVSGGINQVSRTSWKADEPFKAKTIVSLRQIIDLDDLSKSLMIHTTGQSGHPGHRHYDDFIEEWVDVQYHSTLWDRDEVEAMAKEKLILKPR